MYAIHTTLDGPDTLPSLTICQSIIATHSSVSVSHTQPSCTASSYTSLRALLFASHISGTRLASHAAVHLPNLLLLLLLLLLLPLLLLLLPLLLPLLLLRLLSMLLLGRSQAPLRPSGSVESEALYTRYRQAILS